MIKLLVLLILTLFFSTAAVAETAPCVGTDLLDELARTDPPLWQKVVSDGRRVANGNARLWRIEKPGVPASYLLATLHSTDPRITAISPALDKALTETRTIAIEIADISPMAMLSVFKTDPDLVLYTSGQRMTSKLKAEELATVRARLDGAGLPPEFVVLLRPWFASTLLSMPDCERLRKAEGLEVLDVLLAAEGRRRGHVIVGLESVLEQMQALAAVPDAEQITALRMAVAWSPRAHDVLESVQQRYLRREIDLAWPLHLALAAKAGFPAEMFRGFQSKVLVERNLLMRDRSLRLLADGRALVAVGALHLVGEKGLVALYREAGYSVVAVE